MAGGCRFDDLYCDIVICFDESLNKISQLEQMDVHVRFWDDDSGLVSTRYLNSAFMGHTTAQDLKDSLQNALLEIDIKHVIQISMDGPSVYLKFFRDFKGELQETNPDAATIVELGSCGLHVVHGAFKAGFLATGWDIVDFLRALYNLFKNVPARRADYTKYSKSATFPSKFCAVRWVENSAVVAKALEVLPNVRKYIDGVTNDKHIPKCNSFNTVRTMLQDPFLSAKLCFFQKIANDLEPFLKEFQTNAPMSPFLYEELQHLLQSLLRMCIKKEVLDSANTVPKLLKIDMSDKSNHQSARAFDVGYGTKVALKQIKNASEKGMLAFKNDSLKCVIKVAEKLIQRSPLKYLFTKGVSCLTPSSVLNSAQGDKALAVACQHLTEQKWISGFAADRIDKAYRNLHNKEQVIFAMKNFNRQTDRLDCLWNKILISNSDEDLSDFAVFVKLLLTLSHGNAVVERGFSVNKECVAENMREESLVAQRIICDAVNVLKSIENIEINKPFIHSMRNSFSLYSEALKKKQKESEEIKTRDGKRKLEEHVKELKVQKQRILASAQHQANLIEEEIFNVKKKM